MYQLRYEITTIDPILITSNVGDINMISTLDYIPGTSILGLFANKYNKYIKDNDLGHNDHKNCDCSFNKWFLSGKLCFLNAFKAILDEEEEKKRGLPIPMSIQHIKNDKYDISDLLFKESEDEKQRLGIKDHYCLYQDGELITDEVNKGLSFHHTRIKNRINGHAKDGAIFNYESIDPRQVFKGVILGEKNDLDKFSEFIVCSSERKLEFTGRLGRSKGTQYGRVQIRIDDNIDEFESEAPVVSSEDEEGFSLTFLSNAIIYNQEGFSSVDCNVLETKLARALKVEDSQINIEKCFVKSEYVENFVSIWGLRKPSEVAFKMGSCFWVKVAEDVESLDDKIKTLQLDGLGIRRGEGFGRVAINWQQDPRKKQVEEEETIDSQQDYGSCDEEEMSRDLEAEKKDWQQDFGLYKRQDASKEKSQKPALPIPDVLKDKLKKLMQKRIEQQVVSKARIDQGKFVNVPPASLISRLELLFRNNTNEKNEVFRFSDEKKFIYSLKNTKTGLRETAREKLCKANNITVTLWEFIVDSYFLKPETGKLQKEIFNPGTITNQEKEFLKVMDSSPQDDPEFCASLYRKYWQTFWGIMRKEAKKEDSHEKTQ